MVPEGAQPIAPTEGRKEPALPGIGQGAHQLDVRLSGSLLGEARANALGDRTSRIALTLAVVRRVALPQILWSGSASSLPHRLRARAEGPTRLGALSSASFNKFAEHDDVSSRHRGCSWASSP